MQFEDDFCQASSQLSDVTEQGSAPALSDSLKELASSGPQLTSVCSLVALLFPHFLRL